MKSEILRIELEFRYGIRILKRIWAERSLEHKIVDFLQTAKYPLFIKKGYCYWYSCENKGFSLHRTVIQQYLIKTALRQLIYSFIFSIPIEKTLLKNTKIYLAF